MRQAFCLTRGCFLPIINNTRKVSCARRAQPPRQGRRSTTHGNRKRATRGGKKQKKGISGCSAVGARSRAPPAAETARRKCWAAMRAMQGRAKAAAARHMATGSAPRAVVKNRRKEYRGVAQLVARHIWENTPRPPHNFISGCSAVGSAPALGAGCRRFESCHSDHLLQKNRLKRRFFCVLSSVFAVLTIVVLWRFKG